MPVNQYDQPVRYQYKSRGLEKLAKPLAAMQERYDITQGELSDTDFELKYLPYGTDPTRAKEIISEFEEGRDKIASDLMISKNFRKSAQDLKNLNKRWGKHHEAKALQSNYENWQELSKEQRDRFKNDPRRYSEWEQRSISEFDSKGGTSYQNENKYNTLGRQRRLEDISDEFRKEALAIANAQPEKRGSMLGAATGTGIDGEIMRIVSKWSTKSKAEIAKETEAYLRKIPKYQKFFNEEADYRYYFSTQDREGQEKGSAKKEIGKRLLTNYSKGLAAELEKKGVDKDSEEYKANAKEKARIDKQLESGKYNEQDVKGLYTRSYKDHQFDQSILGDILSYKNVVNDYKIKNLPTGGAGANRRKNQSPFERFVETGYEDNKLSTLTERRYSSAGDLYNTVSDILKTDGGALRHVILGWEKTKHRKNMVDNPSGMYSLLQKMTAINDRSTKENFQRNL